MVLEVSDEDVEVLVNDHKIELITEHQHFHNEHQKEMAEEISL